jgi:membrane protease YdiL (CAAX protease family)
MSDASMPPPGESPPVGEESLFDTLAKPGGEAPRLAAWGPVEALQGLLVVLMITFGGGLLLLPFTGDTGPDWKIGNQLLGPIAFIAAAWLIASRLGLAAVADQLGFRAPNRSNWPLLVFGGFLAAVGFGLVFSSLVAQPEQEELADNLGLDDGTGAVIAAGFAVMIAAPIAEEVFFRGFLFAGLRSRMPFVAAALISGVVFGSAHLLGGNGAAAVQLAVLGMILAWLYERTDSLWTPIALHAVNNVIAFAFLASS